MKEKRNLIYSVSRVHTNGSFQVNETITFQGEKSGFEHFGAAFCNGHCLCATGFEYEKANRLLSRVRKNASKLPAIIG
jgi:hypothetical protein